MIVELEDLFQMKPRLKVEDGESFTFWQYLAVLLMGFFKESDRPRDKGGHKYNTIQIYYNNIIIFRGGRQRLRSHAALVCR